MKSALFPGLHPLRNMISDIFKAQDVELPLVFTLCLNRMAHTNECFLIYLMMSNYAIRQGLKLMVAHQPQTGTIQFWPVCSRCLPVTWQVNEIKMATIVSGWQRQFTRDNYLWLDKLLLLKSWCISFSANVFVTLPFSFFHVSLANLFVTLPILLFHTSHKQIGYIKIVIWKLLVLTRLKLVS